MIRRSLAARMGMAIIVLILSVVSVLYVIIGQLFEDAFQANSEQQLQTQITQYTNMAATGGASMMQMMAKGTEDVLVMVNHQGATVVRTPISPVHSPSSKERRLITQVLHGKRVMMTGWNEWFGETGVMVGAPIRRGGSLTGAVFLFRSEAVIQNSIRRVQGLLVLAGLGAIIFASGVTLMLSNRIAGPLRDIVRAAREFGRGNYQTQVPVQGDDEIAMVGRAINQLARDLQDMHQNRNEFLANISHELRTPLSYVRGYSQVVSEGLTTDPAERDRYLRIIYDETVRIEQLVSDLFALAQADAGELTIAEDSVDMRSLILHTVSLVEGRAASKGLEIETKLGGKLSILADKLRLEQVLLNLLENAVRYTEPPGRITVSLSEDAAGMIRIDVADTGKGIPEKDLPHIFERMYRVEKSRTRARGGSGLGLAIVKQIVELHGGEVHVRSSEHHGTTFTVRLTATQTPAERRLKQ